MRRDELARDRGVETDNSARIDEVVSLLETLAAEDINIEMIHTSPIKITCVIQADSVPTAVRPLRMVTVPE